MLVGDARECVKFDGFRIVKFMWEKVCGDGSKQRANVTEIIWKVSRESCENAVQSKYKSVWGKFADFKTI